MYNLIDMLKEGGYILYVRHGEATIGSDMSNIDFTDCLTQRDLSEYGKTQAKYYGDAIHKLKIPVNYPIIVSPYCRTTKTGEIAFGLDNIVTDPFLVKIQQLSENISQYIKEKILDEIYSYFENIPEQGGNKVVVAHSFPRNTGLGYIPNMGTVIIKPLGKGNGFRIIDKLSFSDFVSI